MTQAGKRSWLVIGGGVSGLGAAQLIQTFGEPCRVSERGKVAPEQAAAFKKAGAELCDGGHDLAHLNGVTHIVVSPGLPPAHPLLVAARARELAVLSEIDLALGVYKGKVIGVTGTNGKSTTCAMIGHLLAKLGKPVNVGGNFGDPPTAIIAEGRAADYMVLELSSYQLEQSELVAPAAAVFTSFSHDHIARHGTLEGYIRAKWKIFQRMPAGALCVLPEYVHTQAKAMGLQLPKGAAVALAYPSKQAMDAGGERGFVVGRDGLALRDGTTLPIASLALREPQNLLNAGFALACVAHVLNLPPAQVSERFGGFRGLPHRCELVGRIGGKAVVNDSKSTNVESTLVALAGQPEPVVLMMGGQGKAEPYGPILAEKARLAAVVTFGASGPEIARDLRGQVAVHEFPTLKAAIAGIDGIIQRYRTGLLFSPGCASFDEFKNYEERGAVFCRAMQSHLDP